MTKKTKLNTIEKNINFVAHSSFSNSFASIVLKLFKATISLSLFNKVKRFNRKNNLYARQRIFSNLAKV